ncbi:dipeptidase [Puteibacter caeruleilacunae]|nr:dipeptidase [Puteibacter caeruleilacunae]
MKTERRQFLRTLGLFAAGGTVVPMAVQGNATGYFISETLKNNMPREYPNEVKQLVQENTCIDMLGTHGNWIQRRQGMTLTNYWERIPSSFTEEDFLFVKKAGIDVFGWGAMNPTYEKMLQFMALQNGLVASNPQFFERIDTKAKLKNLQSSGKIGILITNQNSEHFRTVKDVAVFYAMGQRVSQLTYNGKNRLGCGAFEDTDTGITPFGIEIVQEMNKIGMGVDVSHCADKTTMGAIEVSTKPVLITHGSCRSLAKGVARAKTDEAIKAVAKTGGVIGIPILRFMVREKEPVNVEHFLAHIDHVAQIAGIEHVGIGSDQGLYTEDYGSREWRKARLENAPAKYQCHTNDDYLLTIEGLNHPFRTYDIAEGLLKKGYTDEHVKMVLGKNFQRALIEIFNH